MSLPGPLHIVENQLIPSWRWLVHGIVWGMVVHPTTHADYDLLRIDEPGWAAYVQPERIPRRRLLAMLWREIDWWMAMPDDYRWEARRGICVTRCGERFAGEMLWRYPEVHPRTRGGREHR